MTPKTSSEERVAHTTSAADFTPWTFQMLHDIGESMRHDATVVLTDATGTDYLIDGFKLRDGVAKILIVERYQRSESQPSSEQTSENEIRTALVDALRAARKFIVIANGETAPFVKVALNQIDDALAKVEGI